MGRELAGRAEPDATSEIATQDHRESALDIQPDRDNVRVAAARLYGRGYTRRQIKTILWDHLVALLSPNMQKRPPDQVSAAVRLKLRNWERQQSFRDLVYENAVRELDLDLPNILKGVAKKAKKGRVDAARLALEVTGRHNPRGDVAPTQIALVVNGVPRPKQVQAFPAPKVLADGDIVVDEGDEE